VADRTGKWTSCGTEFTTNKSSRGDWNTDAAIRADGQRDGRSCRSQQLCDRAFAIPDRRSVIASSMSPARKPGAARGAARRPPSETGPAESDRRSGRPAAVWPGLRPLPEPPGARTTRSRRGIDEPLVCQSQPRRWSSDRSGVGPADGVAPTVCPIVEDGSRAPRWGAVKRVVAGCPARDSVNSRTCSRGYAGASPNRARFSASPCGTSCSGRSEESGGSCKSASGPRPTGFRSSAAS